MPHEFRLDKANSPAPVMEPAAAHKTAKAPVETKAPEEKKDTDTTPPEGGEPEQQQEKKPAEAPAEAGATPAPKGEDDDLGPPDPRHKWEYSAVKAEREKRRAIAEAKRKADEELAYLRGRIAAMEQTPKVDVAPPPQPAEADLDLEYFQQPRTWTERKLANVIETIREERHQERLELSEERAREKWKDYDEVASEFTTYLQTLPRQQAAALFRTIRAQQRDPAAYVYNQVRTAREARKMGGSVEQYMAKVEAETRARLEAEYKQKAAVAAAESVPKTMAGGAGPGLNAPPGPQGLSEWDRHWAAKKF